MTSRVLILSTVACLAVTPFVTAQEPPHLAELRFVDELRKRGDTGLAMDYLQRLKKNPSPELAKELPFEIAKLSLTIGAEEPISSKRLELYQQARDDFERFLRDNPDSPRAGEARLQIATVSVLQARTQLSQALSQDTLEGRVLEALKARKMFVDAGKQLDAAYAELEAQLKKVPEKDKLRRAKLESDLLQAEFSKALNIFDQAQTYLNTGSNQELRARGDVLEAASQALQKIADKDNNTIGWQATAWLARCQQLLGSPKDARTRLVKLVNYTVTPANAAAIADAHRLGLYFLMLLNKENPDPMDKDPVLTAVNSAHFWLKTYPRHLNTPEGYGVRYFLAENLIAQADRLPKGTPEQMKTALLQEARDRLKEIEHSENDFTDRARHMTISLIDRQGGFKVPIEQLKTFEDCYLRSQYEIYMIPKDLEGVKELKDREAKVKARREAAMKVLELGLAKPEAQPNAQGKYSYDVNNAKLALAFHYVNNGRNKEAIKIAEALAHDVRTNQAPMAAVYAIQAHVQYLAERELKVASKDELKPDRDNLLKFAEFAETQWHDKLAGNLAVHQVGMMLLRDKQLGEAIKKLNTVTPSYPNYALVKYQISEACLAAEKAKVEPIKELGSYSEIAMKALQSIPDSVLGSPDPTINHIFFISRIRIGQELFKNKKYVEMEKLAASLIPKLATARLDLDDKRNAQLQAELAASLNTQVLYAKYGQADAEFNEKHYPKVMELLGPIVAQINNGEHAQLRNDPRLANSLLSMALKSAMQLNNLDQTKAVLAAMQKVGGDNDGIANTLLQLVELIQSQIDDLKKKGDKEALAQAVKSFKHILDDVDKGQKTKTMEYNYLLAKNYAALDLHEKASNVLERVELPTKTGMKEADDKNERVYHTVRAAYIRELRLSGDKETAAKVLDEGLGTAKAPGWAVANVDANLEKVLLLEEDAKFGAAATHANLWVNKLKGKADTDAQVREKYLEFYYHTAYGFYKYGVGMKEKGEKAKGDKAIKDAATQLVALDKTWKGFGSEASTKRIQELFEAEPDLKAQFDALKK